MIKTSTLPRHKSQAQAMVEFALALPILLLVVYGLLEAGRLLFIYASVVTAARQAARYGSATGLTTANINYYEDCSGIRAAARKVAFINQIRDSDIQITYDHGLDNAGNPRSFNGRFPTCWDNRITVSNGDRIRVQVSSRWDPIVRLIPGWTGYMITSQSNRTLLVGASIAIDAAQQGYHGSGQMVLIKTAAPETYDTVGQVITYTFTLTNPGTDPIAGPVSITDDKLGNVGCPIAAIPGGNGSAGCTANYAITQTDINNLSLTNTATAIADNNGQPISASSSATITAVPRPALSLTKAGVAPELIANNAIIVYTYTLQNVGNIPLTAPYGINDNKIRSQNIDCSTAVTPLPPGGTTTCTGRYSVSNQDISVGQVVNVATATAMYKTQTITSAEATATVLTPPMILTLTASPTSVSTLGQVVTFTYTLRNPGNNDLTSPFGLTTTNTGIKVDCSGLPSRLAPGASAACTGTYTVTQKDLDAGSIIDSAIATAQQKNKTVSSNSASVMVIAAQTVQLTMTKTASLAQATVVGTTISYTYTLKNTGNVTLTAPYAVTDDKIPLVNCAGATGGMPPGATKTCTASYVTVQADLDEGPIINHAIATATFLSQTVTSAPASTIVITYAGARLGLSKTANPSSVSSVVGQAIAYTYTLKNTGGINLTGPFTVSDNKIPGVDCSAAAATLAPGDSTTCKGSYITTTGDVNTGSVTNTATASDGSGHQATASATVPVYVCNSAPFTYGPVQSSSDVKWLIDNATGAQVRISSITIQWTNVTSSSLKEVDLAGNTIWSGTDTSGNFTVPGQSWVIDPGSTPLRAVFSAPATEIRGTVTLVGLGCPN